MCKRASVVVGSPFMSELNSRVDKDRSSPTWL